MKSFKRKTAGCSMSALSVLALLIGLAIMLTSCASSDEAGTAVPTVVVDEGASSEGIVTPTTSAEVEIPGSQTVVEQQDDGVTADDAATDEDFIEAVRNGQLDEVQLLLDAGADVNTTMTTHQGSWDFIDAPAITHAVLTDHGDMVELLIAHGADIELVETGYLDTAVHTAAHLNNGNILRILLENGADPNPISKHTGQETPLHYAAEAGGIDAIQVLLDAGVDVDVRVGQGWTPLMLTIKEGEPGTRTEVATLLLDNGADPNLQDVSGFTALHDATRTSAEVISLLIERGVDMDIQSDSGDTALHLAARANRVEAVGILIEHGASLELKNGNDETALDVARQNESAEILRQAAN